MADPLETLIGERVRDLRTRLGLSQGEVAARMTALGAPTKTPAVSMVETGRRRLTLPELATLLLALGGGTGVGVGTEVRKALFNLDGVDDPNVRDQLTALGGVDLGGPALLMGGAWEPTPQVQAEAERIAEDRRRERLMERITYAIPWRELGLGSDDDRYFRGLDDHDRDLILGTIDDLFQTRDPVEARELLVAEAVGEGRAAGVPQGVETTAQHRGWATRRLIEMLVDELRNS